MTREVLLLVPSPKSQKSAIEENTLKSVLLECVKCYRELLNKVSMALDQMPQRC